MKTGIHPDYHVATVTCSCGNTFDIGATVKEMRVELCAACHPFYTGTQKFIDTAGRLEKFQNRLAQAHDKSKKLKLAEKTAKTESNKERLKELKKKLITQ